MRLPESYGQKISWFNCFLLYIAWKRGIARKFAHFVLFRLIKKRSFNLLCVLDLFSEHWQSTLFQIFFLWQHSTESKFLMKSTPVKELRLQPL